MRVVKMGDVVIAEGSIGIVTSSGSPNAMFVVEWLNARPPRAGWDSGFGRSRLYGPQFWRSSIESVHFRVHLPQAETGEFST